jgi:hypothetical protein
MQSLVYPEIQKSARMSREPNHSAPSQKTPQDQSFFINFPFKNVENFQPQRSIQIYSKDQMGQALKGNPVDLSNFQSGKWFFY